MEPEAYQVKKLAMAAKENSQGLLDMLNDSNDEVVDATCSKGILAQEK